jgi:hypothetical protein
MLLVEGCEVCKWVFTNDIGVQNEKWGIVFSQNFACEFEGSSGAERFCFDGECNFDVKSLFILFDPNCQKFEPSNGFLTIFIPLPNAFP